MMNEIKVFADKHTHALSKLGYRFVLLDPSGEVYQSTIDKYMIERADGTRIGTIEPKVQEVPQSARRPRKRRSPICFNQQTGYIAKLRAMNPGDTIVLTPPLNVPASVMQHAVHNSGTRFFGKGNFETAVVDKKLLVFYKGPMQAELV